MTLGLRHMAKTTGRLRKEGPLWPWCSSAPRPEPVTGQGWHFHLGPLGSLEILKLDSGNCSPHGRTLMPGGPVVKIPCSQCRGPGFDPWSGNEIPCATTKDWFQSNK